MSTTVWPTHFPSHCPPSDAADLSHTVLYLVTSDPPTADDFVSALERNWFVGKPDCERASLSCGITLEYIQQLRESVPRLRQMLIVESQLDASHGKIKPTGKPGHHSMWLLAVALQRAPTLFRVKQ